MKDLITKENKIAVQINSQTEALELAYVASNCKTTISARREQWVVNAASVLGLLSLDISKPIELLFKNYEDFVKYADCFTRWRVEDEVT